MKSYTGYLGLDFGGTPQAGNEYTESLALLKTLASTCGVTLEN